MIKQWFRWSAHLIGLLMLPLAAAALWALVSLVLRAELPAMALLPALALWPASGLLRAFPALARAPLAVAACACALGYALWLKVGWAVAQQLGLGLIDVLRQLGFDFSLALIAARLTPGLAIAIVLALLLAWWIGSGGNGSTVTGATGSGSKADRAGHGSVWLLLLIVPCPPLHADTLTIAAAADLRFALDALIAAYRLDHPAQRIDPVYGSSGMLHAQIRQGAPFDLFFSADIRYPRELAEQGLAASAVLPYACGRLVLWRAGRGRPAFTLADLDGDAIGRLAIANPEHAPYGQRAVAVLQSLGVYERLRPRLVIGENIAQAAQFAQSGAVDAGIIALSLALAPSFLDSGSYALIPADLHPPLEQGFIITKAATDPAAARAFAAYVQTRAARDIFQHFGFELPRVHAAPSIPTPAFAESKSACAG